MTSFETEVYNRSEDNVIGARVIVVADNGQTIDSIQVTNKTQFDELKNKLNTLNEDYIQFDEDSPLAGKSIDDILANTVEDAVINATKLGGFASDSFAKAGHKHVKSEITDLYNYDISCSKYNLNLGSLDNSDKQATVTVKVTNTNNSPVNNHQVLIYKNGSLWKTGRTNSNGQYSATYTAETQGLVTFQVNNQKVQCNVIFDTGWVDLQLNSNVKQYSSDRKPQYRVCNNVVEIRGAVSPIAPITFDNTQSNNVVASIPAEYAPSSNIYIVQQGSNAFRFLMGMSPTGNITVDRYTNDSTVRHSCSTTSWLNLNTNYLLG